MERGHGPVIPDVPEGPLLFALAAGTAAAGLSIRRTLAARQSHGTG